MATIKIKVCDVCGAKIKAGKKDPRESAVINLLKEMGSDVDDICVSCIDRMYQHMRNMPQLKKKKRASKEYAGAMRGRLCELVDKGTRERGQILIQLAREFPHYTNIDSINKRISELMSIEEAYLVTRRADPKYHGKVASLNSEDRLCFK